MFFGNRALRPFLVPISFPTTSAPCRDAIRERQLEHYIQDATAHLYRREHFRTTSSFGRHITEWAGRGLIIYFCPLQEVTVPVGYGNMKNMLLSSYLGHADRWEGNLLVIGEGEGGVDDLTEEAVSLITDALTE